MKLVVINKKTLYLLIITSLVVIIATVIISFYNRTKETFNMDVYYKGNVEDKIVAFACNVDWGNEYIKPMLDIFSNYDIKITYFVTGRWAKDNPELLKTIYNEGHEIGNHGYQHIDYDKLDYERNKEEILMAHDIIENILGIQPKFFAPPSGAYNENTVKAAKDLDYDVILWSVDTIDWKDDTNKELIVKRVKDKIHESAIVLMHPTKETVKTLPEIISYLFDKGYKIGTIGDIVK